MKKTNKKGFTIVELVIVIAVIAILAAVLIPTFSGVVAKATESKVKQAARNCYTELLAEVNGTPANIAVATFTQDISNDTGVTTIVLTQSAGATTAIVFKTADGSVKYTVSTGAWSDYSTASESKVASFTAATIAS